MIARRMMQAAGVTPNEGGGGANKLLDDLIAYYEMDETSGTRADSVGSLDLTDNNTVGNRTGVNATTAADFIPANNEYLSLSTGVDAPVTFGDEDFSIALWVLYDTTHVCCLVAKYRPVDGQREYQIQNINGDIVLYISNNGSASGQTFVIGDSISNSTWSLVVATYDATANEMAISVDAGTPVTETHSGGCSDRGSQLFIGQQATNTQELDGGVQKLGFWGRVLDSDDITALYNSGDGIAYADFESS